jgi:hypothetical protein
MARAVHSFDEMRRKRFGHIDRNRSDADVLEHVLSGLRPRGSGLLPVSHGDAASRRPHRRADDQTKSERRR